MVVVVVVSSSSSSGGGGGGSISFSTDSKPCLNLTSSPPLLSTT